MKIVSPSFADVRLTVRNAGKNSPYIVYAIGGFLNMFRGSYAAFGVVLGSIKLLYSVQ